MVGADGLGSKEGVRVFSLIVLAQFVWRVSSAAIPARRPQVVAPPDRMPRPYRAVRRARRDVRQRELAMWWARRRSVLSVSDPRERAARGPAGADRAPSSARCALGGKRFPSATSKTNAREKTP